MPPLTLVLHRARRGGAQKKTALRQFHEAEVHTTQLWGCISIGCYLGVNKKFITSPSCTMYSLPSARIFPASLAPCSPLYVM